MPSITGCPDFAALSQDTQTTANGTAFHVSSSLSAIPKVPSVLIAEHSQRKTNEAEKKGLTIR